MKIYEVARSTPYGDMTMGLYLDRAEAEKHMNDWNKPDRYRMDRAKVYEQIVLEKYEPKEKKPE